MNPATINFNSTATATATSIEANLEPPKLKPPKRPTEVAKELRQLSLKTAAHLENLTKGESNSAFNSLANARSVTNSKIEKAFYAAETRRVSEIRNALLTLKAHLAEERRIAAKLQTGDSAHYLMLSRENVKKMVDLIQMLPTQADLPRDGAENMLRAIMAVLRTGGQEGAALLKWEEVIQRGSSKG